MNERTNTAAQKSSTICEAYTVMNNCCKFIATVKECHSQHIIIILLWIQINCEMLKKQIIFPLRNIIWANNSSHQIDEAKIC